MCGIAGVFGRQVGLDPTVIHGVHQMIRAQFHRGPDDEGWLEQEDFVVGHRRLSILDLSPSGRQPMSNEDGRVWVVYNGEIYNHRGLHRELQDRGHQFNSSSDTEVLVHGYEEWGIEGLLCRLRGMFAFALYDSRLLNSGPRLILARDRFGIKPLYYAFLQDLNRLIFASEVRSLRQSGLILDESDSQAWLAFLIFGSIPAPWTTVRGVRVLPPGHYLTADRSGMSLARYYDFDTLFTQSLDLNKLDKFIEPSNSNGPKELEAEIRHVLEETVGLHLISDAPLGVFLSGGIDSSALVALAACHKKDLVTLGVLFDEKVFSEEMYQKIVAERFMTEHHSVPVTLRDFEDELERFFSAMDQPTVDGLNTYFVARAARNVGIKAILSGIGGDEIFAGYPTLRRAAKLWRFYTLPAPLRSAIISLGRRRPSLRKLAFLQRKGRMNFYLVQRGLFTPDEVANLLGADEREVWEVVEALEPSWAPQHPVILQQFLEARHYLVEQLLKDADVFGMAHSVEIRVPFLDHLLVEAVLKTPLTFRFDRRWPKPLLTKPLQNLIPEQVIFRPKAGFTFPMDNFLRSSSGLLGDGCSEWDRDSYRAVWQAFRSGRAHWSRPWALAVLAHAQRKE